MLRGCPQSRALRHLPESGRSSASLHCAPRPAAPSPPAARPCVRAAAALRRGRPGTEGSSSLPAPAALVVAVAVVVVVVSAVAWAMANYIHVPPGSPEVPKLDVTVQDQEEQRCRDGALSLLRHLRPHWDPREVTLQVRPGGDRDAFPKPLAAAATPARLPGMAAPALVMLGGSFLFSRGPHGVALPPRASLPSLPYPAWDLPTSSVPRENSLPERNDRGPAAHARMLGNAILRLSGRLI